MGLFNPKVGNVYRFTVRFGKLRPRLYVVYAPDAAAAEKHLRDEWPAATIKPVRARNP